jgi:RNA polymerase sigma factor (sigma-70 family)
MLPPPEGSAAAAVSPPGPALPIDGFVFPSEANLNSPDGKPTASPNLLALTSAVWRGDAEAFSRFYDLYSFRLYKFLFALTRGKEDEAREACQAVFIKLAKRCDLFEDESKLWAWLRVLAKNAYVDQWRARQRLNRFVPLEELPTEPAARLMPEDRLGEILREALQAMPSDESELLRAAYVDKRPLQELAAEAGLTYKAVESRLGRLRQRLKTQLLKGLRHENEL